jgi:xanthine dehydrogenase accessory factor
MVEFWRALNSRLSEAEPAFLAIVVAHRSGSPGTTGAKLFVPMKGNWVGTIGGGRMEFELVQSARDALCRGSYSTQLKTLHHRRSGPGDKSGMICSGQQTNAYHLCRRERDGSLLTRITQHLKQDRPGVVSLSENGLHFTADVLSPNGPAYELIQRGGHWTYREQILNLKRVAIFGGGHCGLALSRAMTELGYAVTVIDDRDRLEADESGVWNPRWTRVADYRDAAARLPYPELTYVIVMTTDCASDVRALDGVLERGARFVGVMGSPAKLQEIKRELARRGHETVLETLHAPAGLPIDSHTPAEIAISVAAQIVKDANARSESRPVD